MNPNASLETNGTRHAGSYSRRSLAPAVDVFENGDELLVVVDLPGVPASAVALHIENDELTLSARRPPRSDASPALVREYEEVDFETTFRIPAGVDANAVSAETKNGTLFVKLPKAAAAKTRKITVRSGE
jgi:HSP20 family molecular chaperone IbpA